MGATIWRRLASVAAVAVVAVIAHMCASFGLFLSFPAWVAPVVIGAAVAAACRQNWATSATGTAIGVTIAVLAFGLGTVRIPIPGLESSAASLAIFVVLGSAASAGAAFALERLAATPRAEWIFAIVLVVVIVAALWTTAEAVNSGAMTTGTGSLNERLMVRPNAMPYDSDLYLRLFYDVHDGLSYYDTATQIYRPYLEDNRVAVGVTSYRLPTLFYLWRLLPRRGDAIPWAFLAFATLAVASAFAISAQLSRPGVAVLGGLFMATAYLRIAANDLVLFVDGWAMALSLCGIALYISSVLRGSRRLLWASVAVLFAGAALREIMIYPLLIGAASVLLLPSKRRWRELVPWLVGLAGFAAVYIAHIIFIAGRVNGAAGTWLQGGVGHVWATLQFFQPTFGAAPWLLPALALAGVLGALSIRRAQLRISAFLTVAIAAPLLGFLVLGNGGQDMQTGAISGYWGMLVVPIALAAAPLSIAKLLVAIKAPSAR